MSFPFSEIKGQTVEDPDTGLCYRIDDLMSGFLPGDYWIGLQLLGQGETQDLTYVNLDRFDQMISYTPFDS